ncbi:hypothetical protein AAFF_G00328480 [Aldrovandia affinis]|uniref:PDZ domain-containing protein n=1 Tax=Aldrovandia affinis TaxID=143900 RepID=A0AAD7X1M0_9TELE|nr:hypothetical protein AAFF_G00328480 [Aldrovandia affinis]
MQSQHLELCQEDKNRAHGLDQIPWWIILILKGTGAQPCSEEETAGLTTGGIIVTVNGFCTEGSAHQHIVDLIQTSTNLLMMETMIATVVKRIELEKKMRLLKVPGELRRKRRGQSLREKWVELRVVTLQEQRLIRGNLNDYPPLPTQDSPVYLSGPTGLGSECFSSVSSYMSVMTEDSEDGTPLPYTLEDLSPFSPCHASAMGDACSFQGITGAFSPFGTLAQKARRGSTMKHFMKFIPGLNHSVEEEENH